MFDGRGFEGGAAASSPGDRGAVGGGAAVPTPAHPDADLAPSSLPAGLLEWAGADLTLAGRGELLEAVECWDRVMSWAAAMQAEAIAEFAHRAPAAPGMVSGSSQVGEFVVDEISTTLTLSRQAAHARLSLALDLERLAGTRAALSAGQIDVGRARAITQGVTHLDENLAAAVEAAVLPHAPGETAPRLRDRVTREALRADPRAAEERHRHAKRQRRVVLTPGEDGMAEIWALLPATDAMALYAALTALGRMAIREDTGKTYTTHPAQLAPAHPAAEAP